MFGLGFTEILIIVVIAVLFLGPDKLPSAMIDIAKFFRQMKKTIGNVKDTLEEELNVSEMKNEALAYKKELLDAGDDIKKSTSIPSVSAELSNIKDDIFDMDDDDFDDEPKPPKKAKKVTFDKKSKKKEEDIDV